MKKNLRTALSKNRLLISAVILCVAAGLLFAGCKKKNAGEEAETVSSTESESASESAGTESEENDEEYAEFNFYSPALDNGDWVEELLARIEEERIADELSSMEESLEEYQTEENSKEEEPVNSESESEEAAEPELSAVEKFFAEEKSGTVHLEKNSQLKFFEFDNEIFSQQIINGNTVLAHADGNSVTRNYYDDKYQLIKKETWNIPSVSQAVLEKTESFEYFEGTSVVSIKNIKEKEFVETVNYNRDGKVTKSERYAEVENKKYIVSKRVLAYNADGQLSSDELTDYIYKDKDYSELNYSFAKKYTYVYNEGEIPPDFKYYENNEIKMHNKYSTEKGTYTSHIYFDDAFSVKTYYENEIRIKDVYYSGNKVMREKVYEKIEPTVQSR